MTYRWIAALLALALPATAVAFETVDTLPWPSAGRFAAYSADPVAPLTYWAQSGLMWDSNVLRTTRGERTETIGRFGIGARYTARVWGRQSVLLEASGDYYDFNRFDVLDHFAFGARGELLWEVGNDLSGNVGYSKRRRAADIGELQRPLRQLITEDRMYVNGAYRFSPDFRLTAGADRTSFEQSGRSLAGADGTTVRGGLQYVSTLGNTVGVEVRRSEGRAPVVEELGLGAFLENRFEETEYALTFAYAVGPQLRTGGRIGHTERTYTELTGREFSGTTGRGFVEWLPSPKLTFLFEMYREPSAIIDTTALHVVRRGTAFGVAWAPTIKLVFSTRFINERRMFQGDPEAEILGTPLRDETVNIVRFGVGWEPLRRWQVSSSLDRGERESNTLGRNYQYSALVLNLRFQY